AQSVLLDQISKIKQQQPGARPESGAKVGQSGTFADVLNDRLAETTKPKLEEGLKFSAHAKSRLQSRNIDLNAEDMAQLQEAVKKVQAKGSKESLILSDKGAFLVSVSNNTVITAIDRDSLKENVFTNIDSTIMI
ncbi:MAG TPA: TIGR02530 family flagellar biosynthesis protein, partial [Bdellovibrionota bacterium]|nr:TIGR02530 family flagellar biosynthesis protein [Bdellovibrionota bacterium]